MPRLEDSGSGRAEGSGRAPGGTPCPQRWGFGPFQAQTRPALCTQLALGHPEGGRAPPPLLLCGPGVPSKLWSWEGPWSPRARDKNRLVRFQSPCPRRLALSTLPDPGRGLASTGPPPPRPCTWGRRAAQGARGPELSRGLCPQRALSPAARPASPLRPQAPALLLATASSALHTRPLPGISTHESPTGASAFVVHVRATSSGRCIRTTCQSRGSRSETGSGPGAPPCWAIRLEGTGLEAELALPGVPEAMARFWADASQGPGGCPGVPAAASGCKCWLCLGPPNLLRGLHQSAHLRGLCLAVVTVSRTLLRV